MRRFLVTIIFCIPSWVFAQDYPHPQVEWPFIRYDANRLIFPGDSNSYAAFCRKLDDLIFKGSGKINIVHIGGSHVQADIFSGRVRERLTYLNPGNKGSRGLVFPYRVAGTNNPYNYFTTYTGKWNYCKNTKTNQPCPLGLSGMAVYTNDTASSISIQLKQENYPAYDFNLIRIFHKSDPNHLSVCIPALDSNMYTVTEDTLAGITEIHLALYLSSVDIGFVKSDSAQKEFMLLGIQLENSDPGITYHALGVNGASTNSFLRCVLFTEHLREVKPDVVIFGLGINDASGSGFDASYFEYNYSRLVQMVKEANPDAAIIFITNNDSYRKYRRRYYVNNNGPVVRESMLKLAKKHNAAVWDLFYIMGGLSSMQTWEANGLAKKDKVHFTSQGYRLIGDLMFSAMVKSYESYLKQHPLKAGGQ